MLFFKKKQKVIITIHGFGKNVQHEFDPLAKHIDKKKYQIIQFDMYDPYDPHDDNYETWIKKAEEKFMNIKDQEIILLGFSNGRRHCQLSSKHLSCKILDPCCTCFSIS